MLRDITIGQYYPVDSILHRLDPRTKLMGTLVFLASVFAASGAGGYLFAAAALFTVIKLSRVPFSYIVRGLSAILLLLVLSVSFNIFMTPGKEIFRLGFLKITEEGLRTAAFMAARLILLVLGSTLMTLTTTPTRLTDGLEKGLGFLKAVGIPVHEMAMMMSIALRFIPILADETDRIMKAQTARGADFETGGPVKRARAFIPLLVPLFVSSFRRASDLALAMEARCYRGGSGRTKMKPLRYAARDVYAYVLMFLYLLLMLAVRFLR